MESDRVKRTYKVEVGHNSVMVESASPEEAAVLQLKTTLHVEIMKVVQRRKLSQKEIAKILDIQQPHVSKLLKGDLERTTADRLTKYLRMLGREVKVTTRAAKLQGAEVA